MVNIGVLGLQGSVKEHILMLGQIGIKAHPVKLPEDLMHIDGLIIPGGESTTIGKLMVLNGLMEPLQKFAQTKPIWGTCAGMALLAKQVGREQPLIGVMDIVVERNAFGRQIDSFETAMTVRMIEQSETKPFPAVFIRAPKIVRAGKNVHSMAEMPDGSIVAALEKHWMVSSFHPELTQDTRLHKFFVTLVKSTNQI